MDDLLELILRDADDPSREADLRDGVAAHIAAVQASAGRGRRSMVAGAEEAVRSDPARAFAFDSTGSATLAAAGQTWAAGRFETLSIADLRLRAQRRGSTPGQGKIRLWVLDGASPATDIGSLQATGGDDTLFQVASQFNCLESPGPYVTRVGSYFSDPTQGPRAAISAFPATLLRHYAAPSRVGGRFVQQTDGPQIDLLEGVLGTGMTRNGYLTGEGVADPMQLVTALGMRFDEIRVGVHDAAQVALGYNWDGAVEDSDPRYIAQVFASTIAGGGYGGERYFGGAAFEAACRQLLRAAYLGTLLAAIALGRSRAVLTLIGGGVFHNPVKPIWNAILWAIDEVERLGCSGLEVVVNGYRLGAMLNLESDALPAVRARSGAALSFASGGLSRILR